MALNIRQLIRRARNYVEIEARTTVTKARFHETFSLFGQEDVVLSVSTTDPDDPEWWVIGGTTPINLYSKRRFPSADEAFSFHTGLMLRLTARDASESSESDEPPSKIGYHAFISHASEDKEKLVRPLADTLTKMGFKVWYDEFTLKVGDSLRQSIDKGLINSRYGIVVLSPSFFAKNWPQYELNGLTAREIAGRKVILPVWHKITKDDLLAYSPTLADKVAVTTDKKTIKAVATSLAEVLAEE
jgi:TIR domain